MGSRSVPSASLPLYGESVLLPDLTAQQNDALGDLRGGVRFAKGVLVGALLSLPFWAGLLWVIL